MLHAEIIFWGPNSKKTVLKGTARSIIRDHIKLIKQYKSNPRNKAISVKSKATIIKYLINQFIIR